ncbi:MAG: hypothetical protein JSV81_02660 [Anaerolineales bacterium]|nr:MAG: hypothetical protein JSV81_02660 [Anaerolineales bacterium]
MVNFLSSLLLALIILIIVLIATFVVTLGFLFVGGVLANWFSLTRLEATGVTLVVGILLTYLIVRIIEIPVPFASMSEDWEEEEDEEEPLPKRRPAHRRRRRK